MQISSLKLDLHALAGTNEVIGVKCTPHYPWDAENNTRSKERKGSVIKVSCPLREFSCFSVVIMDCDYDKVFANGATPMVTFEGFEAHYYKDFKTGEYVLSAKAEKMVVVTTK